MAIETYFQNIADAIREKTGSNGLITPAQMPDEIRSIETGGGDFYFVTLLGGYNGGATVTVYKNSDIIFTSSASSPYNLIYTPSEGTYEDITITITPPEDQYGLVYISLSGGVTFTTGGIRPKGNNSSTGYNYISGPIEGGNSSHE